MAGQQTGVVATAVGSWSVPAVVASSDDEAESDAQPDEVQPLN